MLKTPPRPAPKPRSQRRGDTTTDRASSQSDGEPASGHPASGRTRSTAEWVTLALSSLIVGALVALTTYSYLTQSSEPASIEVEPRLDQTFQSGSRFSVPVAVHNYGGATGEDVKVRVDLTAADGRQETAEWQIEFLPGGSTSRGVAVFGSDPRQGQVRAGVVSYREP